MSLNNNQGCSKCVEPGQELYEVFTLGTGKRSQKMVQYDYRSDTGELFSTVAPTIEEAIERRNNWLNEKNRVKR